MLNQEEGKLFGKLFSAFANRTDQLTEQIIDTYKTQAEMRSDALHELYTILLDICDETPHSSEAGQLARQGIRVIQDALYGPQEER